MRRFAIHLFVLLLAVSGFDAVGRRVVVTNALGEVTRFGFDANGNQVTFTDARGNTTTNVYDALNRVTQVWFPNGSHRTTTYDALSQRVAETDQAGVITQYGFDGWAVLEWECCIKSAEQGAAEGAPFIAHHIIQTAARSFDDFAGAGSDQAANRRMMGLE